MALDERGGGEWCKTMQARLAGEASCGKYAIRGRRTRTVYFVTSFNRNRRIPMQYISKSLIASALTIGLLVSPSLAFAEEPTAPTSSTGSGKSGVKADAERIKAESARLKAIAEQARKDYEKLKADRATLTSAKEKAKLDRELQKVAAEKYKADLAVFSAAVEVRKSAAAPINEAYKAALAKARADYDAAVSATTTKAEKTLAAKNRSDAGKAAASVRDAALAALPALPAKPVPPRR